MELRDDEKLGAKTLGVKKVGNQEVGAELSAGRLATLQLALVPGVGPMTRQALLAALGSPEAILNAREGQLRAVPGVGPELSRRILSARRSDLLAEVEDWRRQGVRILYDGDEAYPRLLAEIRDPPSVLFMRGDLHPVDALSIAIVGSRHATCYGTSQARRFAMALSRAGFTIVSGLARGIDAAAHRGALAAEGRTIAFLASGVQNVYPPDHARLADEVASQGAIVSEAPPPRNPMSGAFPQRNRLISGMSLGVIVVEAAERSGALISARHALEQGREVFAVPGRVDSRLSRGCHRLLRDGAKLVESIDDVIEELGPLVEVATDRQNKTILHPAELQLNSHERSVLDQITTRPTSIDEVVVSSGIKVQQVLATISILELKGLIGRVSGSCVVRR